MEASISSTLGAETEREGLVVSVVSAVEDTSGASDDREVDNTEFATGEEGKIYTKQE